MPVRCLFPQRCVWPTLLALVWLPAAAQSTFFVATDGVDTPEGGSESTPWASITYALDSVPAGSLILVEPGLYQGRIRIRGVFDPPVTIRSRQPYRAQLRHDATVLTVYSDSVGVDGVVIEGFDIAHSGPGAAALVVQIQSLGAAVARRITLRDNILHDSYNNDILKINNAAREIRVLGNLFYNQSGSDEHIDINSVVDVLVEGNVFFNDFAASGRVNGNDTSSYIVIKDSNGEDDAYLGAQDVRVRRNIFLNWQGSTGSNFVLCGEDGHPWYEAFDVLVENNLMLGNSANTMRAAFGVKGCRDVTFRANTVVGDLPASAFAFRLNREASNQVLQNIHFYNNLWSDPTGSMGRFSTTPPADTASFELDRNGYWNGGAVIPQNVADLINSDDDASGLVGDPTLPTQAGLVTPVWNPGNGTFNGGFARIAGVFEHLALTYGRPGTAGVGIGQARIDQMPVDDLLGQPRGAEPSLGALEPEDIDLIFRNGFEN
jgi:hypothetical protein